MISHFHRTIFVHIPKCGGQSIEQAFLTDLDLGWELRAPLLLRPNDEPRLGPPRLAHLLARDYVRYHYLSKDLFEAYYSFSVLRDPVARVISLFNYLKLVNAQQKPLDFESFLSWLERQLAFGKAAAEIQNAPNSHFFFIRPQVDFVTSEDGTVIVKELFFLEQIKESFTTIQERANLRSPLEHRNKSVQRVGKADLTRQQIDFINHAYAADVAFISKHKHG